MIRDNSSTGPSLTWKIGFILSDHFFKRRKSKLGLLIIKTTFKCQIIISNQAQERRKEEQPEEKIRKVRFQDPHHHTKGCSKENEKYIH